MKKVCLVIGAGAGIGGSVGKKFAAEGYHAALCRRSDEAGLMKLVADIESEGGSASGHLVNAVKENAIEDLVAEVEKTVPSLWCSSIWAPRLVTGPSKTQRPRCLSSAGKWPVSACFDSARPFFR